MSGHNIPDPSTLSIDDVLHASAANVQGYLKNTSRRNRHVSSGEGGRGTKVNRAGAVTSADHRTLEAFKTAAARAGSDGSFTVTGDDVAAAAAARQQRTKAEADRLKAEEATRAAMKAEENGGGPSHTVIDDDDDEDWEAVDLGDDTVAMAPPKPEAAATAAAASTSADAKVGDFGPDLDVTGTRAPNPTGELNIDGGAGAGQEQRPLSLYELREVAKAKRWTEKNHLFAQCVVAFALFVRQARVLYRESRHPALSAALTRVPALQGAVDAARTAGEDVPVAAEARRRNDLAPAWVSHAKDATGTAAGSACKRLIAALDTVFELQLPAPADGSEPVLPPSADAAPLPAAAGDDDEDDDAAAIEAAAARQRDTRDGARLTHEVGVVPVRRVLQKAAERAAATTRSRGSGGSGTINVDDDSDDVVVVGDSSGNGDRGPRPCVRIPLPHPAHFTVAFIALASRAGLRCRLCSAFGTYDAVPRETRINGADDAFRTNKYAGNRSGAAAKSNNAGGAKRGGKKKVANDEAAAAAAASAAAAQKKPRSPYWVEVWCPVKRIFFSVNPCPATTTVWSSPYVVACGGDHVADVTARYSSAWSSIFKLRIDEMHYTKGYLWPQEIGLTIAEQRAREGQTSGAAAAAAAAAPAAADPDEDDDNVGGVALVHAFCCASNGYKAAEAVALEKLEPVQRLLWPMCQDVAASTVEMLEREAVQLKALKYSEPVPTTLTELKGHPLFVTEDTITRYEGIYPKTGPAVVGYIKGKPVYRADCVHPLRSRAGWLRLGLMVSPPDCPPYKLAPPPPSRPLVAHSQFYGKWQTVPFRPADLNADGTIPRHEGTSWYLLLSAPAPGAGLAHLKQPNIASVARRMRCEFAVAVVKFVKEHAGQERPGPGGATTGARPPVGKWQLEQPRGGDFAGRVHVMRGRWVPQFDGIVVPAATVESVSRAYDEFVALKAKQEAAKRKSRAMRWWRVLIQHALARLRIQSNYATGGSRGGRNANRLARATLSDI